MIPEGVSGAGFFNRGWECIEKGFVFFFVFIVLIGSVHLEIAQASPSSTSTLRLANGSVYIGEVKNGQPHEIKAALLTIDGRQGCFSNVLCQLFKLSTSSVKALMYCLNFPVSKLELGSFAFGGLS